MGLRRQYNEKQTKPLKDSLVHRASVGRNNSESPTGRGICKLLELLSSARAAPSLRRLQLDSWVMNRTIPAVTNHAPTSQRCVQTQAHESFDLCNSGACSGTMRSTTLNRFPSRSPRRTCEGFTARSETRTRFWQSWAISSATLPKPSSATLSDAYDLRSVLLSSGTGW